MAPQADALTNDQLREQSRRELGADASEIDFLPFWDLGESVRQALRATRASPLVAPDIPVTGWVDDVRTGRLRPVG